MPAQKMPVQFGEWRPDIALLDSQFAADVENVFAGVNSYLPFPSLLPISDFALPAPGARAVLCAHHHRRMADLRRHRDQTVSLQQSSGWTDISRASWRRLQPAAWRPVDVRAERATISSRSTSTTIRNGR